MNWVEYQRMVSVELYSCLHDKKKSFSLLDKISAFIKSQESVAYHHIALFKEFNILCRENGLKKDQVKILDHGCGGGLSILYFMLNGYVNCWGVDLSYGHDIDSLNGLLKEYFGISHDVFSAYPGDKLPFNDESFDFIFSQQVLEHVTDNCVETYILEEQRVLRKNGVVFHQIPQRLTPWDSHTRLWFVHYFPESLRRKLYSFFKKDPNYVESILHFKSRFFYLRSFRKLFSEVEDLTKERISMDPDPNYYDGSVKLRKLITFIGQIPFIGNLISLFVMIDLVARKKYPSKPRVTNT